MTVAGIVFLDLQGWEIDGPRKKRMSENFCTLSTSRYTNIIGHLLWSMYAVVNLKTRASFMGMRLIAQGYMLMRSHAWFNVLLMLS